MRAVTLFVGLNPLVVETQKDSWVGNLTTDSRIDVGICIPGRWSSRTCNDEFERHEGPEWEAMTGELTLEWGAKIIYCLRDEVRVRQMGHANYLEAYEGGQLAWQSIEVIV